MQWFWIFVSIVVVGAGAQAFFIWHSISRSVAISKPIVGGSVAYEQHPANPTKRILITGDSIGVGVGATSKDSLAGRIGRDFPQADITNIAVSGAQLHDLKEKLNAHFGSTYDLVFISIGGNDITRSTSLKEMREILAHILTKAENLGTKVVIMTAGNVGLCPTFLWPLNDYITWRTKEVRKIFIEEVSKHSHASYVDLFNERKDEIFNTDIHRYYAPDLFHPSGDGYGLWFEKLKPQL